MSESTIFFPDRTGMAYCVLANTQAESWNELDDLVEAIRDAGFPVIRRHYAVATDVPFAEVWNRRVRRYTSRRAVLRGQRMRKLVQDVAAELGATVVTEKDLRT